MAGRNLTPTWINSEFFQTILQNSNKGKITNYSIKLAAKEGQHIGGNVIRVNINYIDLQNKNQELSVIIKFLSECNDKLNIKYQNEVKLLQTELKMYSEIIPKFEKMLRDAGDNTLIGPRLLYGSEHPNLVMVLEDLTKSEYSGFDHKRTQIDDTIPDLILDKLAKFHACSYKLNYDNNGCLESYDNSVFKVNENQLQDLMCGGPKQIVKVLKPLANKDVKLKEIVEKLEKIEEKVYKKCNNLYEFSKTNTKLNVLNHGDFHVNNLMFKYYHNKDILQDIQILDFAMCFWSSMAFDVLYLLYSIYTPETRRDKRDEIIYRYFKRFENALKLIGYKGDLPKYSYLLYDIAQLGHLEVWFSTTFLPLVYGVTNQNSNIEDFTQKEDTRSSMYNIPEFLKDIQLILKSCLNYGFLDESYYV